MHIAKAPRVRRKKADVASRFAADSCDASSSAAVFNAASAASGSPDAFGSPGSFVALAFPVARTADETAKRALDAGRRLAKRIRRRRSGAAGELPLSFGRKTVPPFGPQESRQFEQVLVGIKLFNKIDAIDPTDALDGEETRRKRRLSR